MKKQRESCYCMYSEESEDEYEYPLEFIIYEQDENFKLIEVGRESLYFEGIELNQYLHRCVRELKASFEKQNRKLCIAVEYGTVKDQYVKERLYHHQLKDLHTILLRNVSKREQSRNYIET